MEISTFCRVCTKSTFLDYIDLDSPLNYTTYLECFNYCTKLDAELQDALPNTICFSCGQSLQIAYDFIKTAQDADSFLRANFLVSKTTIEMKSGWTCIEDPLTNPSEEIINASNHLQEPVQEDTKFVCLKEEQIDKQSELDIVFHEVEPNTQSICKHASPNDEIIVVDNIEQDEQIISTSNFSFEEVIEEKNDHTQQEDNVSFESKECDDPFLKMEELKNLKPKFIKRFKNVIICRLCGEAFENKVKLDAHKRADHNEKDGGLCITCGQSFPNQVCLKEHVAKEHAPQLSRFKCQHCPRTLTIHTVTKHMKTDHPEYLPKTGRDAVTCKICSRFCVSVKQLKDHMNTHTGERPYKCEKCNKTFTFMSSYRGHIRKEHEFQHEMAKPRSCEKCNNFVTSNRILWTKHRNSHRIQKAPIPKHLCASCPMRFTTPKALMHHEDYAHGDKKIAPECDICKRKFSNTSTLGRHMASVHSEERPFECKECPKVFKFQSALKRHEMLHTGKAVPCPECDKKFTVPADLRVHMRVHTGELPYECHLCDKKYAVRVRLTYHLKRHEGVKYKCQYCFGDFISAAQLRYHVFEHIGYPYVCDYCEEGYGRKRGLYRHVKRAHEVLMTEEDLNQNYSKNSPKVYRAGLKKPVPQNEMIAEI